ncbi:hypothetical protein LX36DRAFT_224578 [Colletotrichum falcatum]|nr:hypothetical protein LX36DRAFT_224578 [Colletotrichum falcatum]
MTWFGDAGLEDDEEFDVEHWGQLGRNGMGRSVIWKTSIASAASRCRSVALIDVLLNDLEAVASKLNKKKKSWVLEDHDGVGTSRIYFSSQRVCDVLRLPSRLFPSAVILVVCRAAEGPQRVLGPKTSRGSPAARASTPWIAKGNPAGGKAAEGPALRSGSPLQGAASAGPESAVRDGKGASMAPLASEAGIEKDWGRVQLWEAGRPPPPSPRPLQAAWRAAACERTRHKECRTRPRSASPTRGPFVEEAVPCADSQSPGLHARRRAISRPACLPSSSSSSPSGARSSQGRVPEKRRPGAKHRWVL